jgi:nucleotide-binding universal stress UspA family protein
VSPAAPVPDRVEIVLVPLDGSEFSERALPVAARLARRLGAEIHLLSAVDDEADVARRKEQLDAYELPCLGLRRSVVISPDPARAIHEELRRLGPRAVACMASHGRGRSAALVGSVATDVVARGHDPLVLVGPLPPEYPDGHGIIVAVDETPASADLLPVCLGWAGLLGEPLTVATVAEPVPPPVRPDRPVRRVFGPDGDVHEFLDRLVAPLRAAGHTVETLALFDPISPADGLEAHLKNHPASLVVVSSRTRAGPARLVFGNVAAAIVRRSPSPVLVVPRADTQNQEEIPP